MLSKEPIVAFDKFDENRVIADRSVIDSYIPHRFEMAQVDGILFENADNMTCVGFKDVAADEFWVRGHFPGNPIMPGVIACECAAQVSAYFAAKYKMVDGVMGLGSIDNVKFRGPIRPGQRMIVMITRKKYRVGMLFTSHFQIFVERTLVADGLVKGMQLPADVLS